jgi:CHAT domain-containing protein
MKTTCSLRLDLVGADSSWAWKYFHRVAGTNPSLSSSIPFPQEVSAPEIYSSFMNLTNSHEINGLRKWGIKCAESILPSLIQQELTKFESGDILFMVPAQWAEIPFELLHVTGEFLCKRFALGTIICTDNKHGPAPRSKPGSSFLIIADPSGNAPQAHAEGIAIQNIAKENHKNPHFISSNDKEKIFAAVENAAIVHFAGHSVYSKEKNISGWQLSNGCLFDLLDMKQFGEKAGVPWLIFSNSCYAGNSGCNQDLAGMAGAFLQAGIAQVIGPITAVNDSEAKAFALCFYELLFKGMSAGQALLTAKLTLSKNTLDVTQLLYRLYGDPCFSTQCTKPPEINKINDKLKPIKLKTVLIFGAIILAVLLIALFIPLGNNIIYIPVKH